MDDAGEGGEAAAVAGGDEPVAVVGDLALDVRQRVAQLHPCVKEKEARERRCRVLDDAGLPGVVAQVADMRGKYVEVDGGEPDTVPLIYLANVVFVKT